MITEIEPEDDINEVQVAIPTELKACELDGRVNDLFVAPNIHKQGPSLKNRMSYPPFEKTPVAEKFPNPLLEALNAILKKEEYSNSKIRGYVVEAEGVHKKIDLLLEFASELNAMDEKKPQLSPRAREILSDLKERGIDLLKGNEELTKKRIDDLSSAVNNQISRLRDDLHLIFTVKMKPETEELATILAMWPDMQKRQDDFIKKTLQLR